MKLFKWVFIGVLAIVGITIVSSLLSIATTAITAPGKVINKTLDVDNIITSYEWFYDTNAAYDARLSQVNQYLTFLRGENDKDEKYRIRTEVAAMQQTCRDLATKYNANSEKMNKKVFKGWALPQTLSLASCG